MKGHSHLAATELTLRSKGDSYPDAEASASNPGERKKSPRFPRSFSTTLRDSPQKKKGENDVHERRG